MKKFVSLLLALSLCMGLAVTASAADSKTIEKNGMTVTLEAVESKQETITFNLMDRAGVNEDWWKTMTETVTTDVYYIPAETSTITFADGYTFMIYTLDKASDGIYCYTDVSYYGLAVMLESATWGMGGNETYDTLFVACGEGETVTSSDYVFFRYAKPEGAEEPVTPVEPETPAEVETPAEPAAPAEPEVPAEVETPVEPETPAVPEVTVPDAPGTYTVKKGDTYGTIALNTYGSYGVWKDLYAANKGVKLTEGTVLTLPETLGKAVLVGAPAAADGETLYTVKAGDTLGAIAKTVYGDVMQYKAIYERNADRLTNANTIYEGQVIVLPAK